MDIEFALPWIFLLLPLPLLALLLPRAPAVQPATIRVPFYTRLRPQQLQGAGGHSLFRLLAACVVT